MNLDALGAVAELIGAVAVIVSLVYLAAQVRQTRLQLQAQAEDNITARALEAYDPVHVGNNAAILRRRCNERLLPQPLPQQRSRVLALWARFAEACDYVPMGSTPIHVVAFSRFTPL